MPLIEPSLDHTQFFGDAFEQLNAKLFLRTEAAWPMLEDIYNLQQAYKGLSRLRNKPNAFEGMSSEAFGQRQVLLDIARRIIVVERNRLLEAFLRLTKGEPVEWQEGS